MTNIIFFSLRKKNFGEKKLISQKMKKQKFDTSLIGESIVAFEQLISGNDWYERAKMHHKSKTKKMIPSVLWKILLILNIQW